MLANPIRGRVDGQANLVAADPMLAGLQQRAGGAMAGPLALPALAGLVRLSLRLGQIIHRPVVIGDIDGDVAAEARITPDANGAELELMSWRAAPSAPPSAPDDVSGADSIAADMRWECDPQLRMIVLTGPAAPDLIGARPWMGRSVSELFALRPDAAGQFPMLRALAAQTMFQDQIAEVENIDMATRAIVRLSGRPSFDAMHGFRGFQGTVQRQREPLAPPTSDPAFGSLPMSDPRFGRRVDGALRGPLSRIIATAETISGQLEGPIRADYARYAGDIALAGRHLLGLIDDLADLQNIERPGFKAARDTIDLGDIGRRAIGLLGMKAEERGIVIVAPEEGVAAPAIGEFRRTLQIMLNLLGNAIRYSPEGSTITLRAAHHGDASSISVADQGQGLAEDEQARIFEKFERLGRTDSGGSGLGLYIARRLARAMAGDIVVASAPGQGACFTLTLPAA